VTKLPGEYTVAYSVVFKVQHTRLPPDLQERARLLLDEIGETCSSVPRDDAFWLYLKESGLTLEYGGWRFWYRIDRRTRELIVYHCEHVGVEEVEPVVAAESAPVAARPGELVPVAAESESVEPGEGVIDPGPIVT
jgi:hypothetical protein